VTRPQPNTAPDARLNPGPDLAQPQTYPWRPHAAAQWSAPPMSPWNQHQPHPTITHGPLFRVRVTKHTGLVIAYYAQSYTVTGTFEQCEAAIRQAQLHNLLAGWWSFWSLAVMNWVALLENRGARKTLRRQMFQSHDGTAR
jgi:hypothetical protein